MNFLKHHPIFSGVVTVFAIVVLAEIWMVYSGERKVDRLESDLANRIVEIDRLQRQKPAPVDDNLRTARDEFEHNAVVLSNMLRVLNVVGPDELEYFKGEPASRTDAWFDISQFVDRMRNAADEHGVALRADERFGFSAYAHEGPEPELMRSVYRQRRIVEYVLQSLFAARPRGLIGVQREEPARFASTTTPGGAGPNQSAAPSGSSSNAGTNPAADLFTIDPQVSARTPGYVETMAFRVIFTGQTAALRGFMNGLAVPEIPLVVRSVEVEPYRPEATPTRSGAPARPGAADAAAERASSNVPIVAENVSRFTVTVELFEVKIRPPNVQTAATTSP